MGKNIDYRIRTAKYIERRMFLDLFRKLNIFGRLEDYRYIGFGSIYFTDFILFHKYLNINDMISIEKKSTQQERYYFNKPYKCIEMIFGECQNVIEEALDIEKRKIIWLDFDSHFDISTVLDSINEIIPHINSGSILLFTFNIEMAMKDEEIEKFKDRLKGYLSLDLKLADFQKANLPYTYKKIIDNYIELQLKTENTPKNVNEKIEYKQLVFTKYKDSIDMLSIGGIFVEVKDNEIYDKANFKEFDFISMENSLHIIEVPILTSKEIHLIDNEVVAYGDKLNRILENEVDKYRKIHKYYPHYVDSDII